MKLQFWFEFASTYSYPAVMRIDKAAAARGVAVEWRPFLLGPLFHAQQGMKDSPFNVVPVKGSYMWRDLERFGLASKATSDAMLDWDLVTDRLWRSDNYEQLFGHGDAARTVAARVPEGRLAAGLMAIQKDFPELAIGSYPYYREDGFGVQLVARGRDEAKVEQAAVAIEALIRAEGAEPARVSPEK